MEGTVAHEQIIINGQEYAPEEASQLIELGNKYRETEKNLNTSLDKLMPDYTRATQEAATYKKQLQERDAEIEKFKTLQRVAETPKEQADVIKAAREAGLADREWLNEQGYIKKSDLDPYLEEKLNFREQQNTQMQQILEVGKKFKQEIDGSDGRVPYNDKAVLAYANTYGFFNKDKSYEQVLKCAYDDMTQEANEKWKDAQIAKSQRPGLTTLKPGGRKAPGEIKVTDDNFKQLWDEMFPSAE